MNIPEFKDAEDVKKFLNYGGDEWCRPMVEEYIEMLAPNVPWDELDIEELNGWIEHEMSSLQQGYQEWGSDRA
jgi:hypothetical protein|tara:strand:+ start:302 stop:520 length:219 start_codon:yes stop_codon:yes gene_type:complete